MKWANKEIDPIQFAKDCLENLDETKWSLNTLHANRNNPPYQIRTVTNKGKTIAYGSSNEKEDTVEGREDHDSLKLMASSKQLTQELLDHIDTLETVISHLKSTEDADLSDELQKALREKEEAYKEKLRLEVEKDQEIEFLKSEKYKYMEEMIELRRTFRTMYKDLMFAPAYRRKQMKMKLEDIRETAKKEMQDVKDLDD